MMVDFYVLFLYGLTKYKMNYYLQLPRFYSSETDHIYSYSLSLESSFPASEFTHTWKINSGNAHFKSLLENV